MARATGGDLNRVGAGAAVDRAPTSGREWLSCRAWQTRQTGRLEDWQFRQAVGAIHKLLELVGLSWRQEVDWPYWLESARSLSADHPSVAADLKLAEI